MTHVWDVINTGEMKLKSFAADPVGAEGMVIYNSTSKLLKYYNGSAWITAGENRFYDDFEDGAIDAAKWIVTNLTGTVASEEMDS
jgi:hypothetical protein